MNPNQVEALLGEKMWT